MIKGKKLIELVVEGNDKSFPVTLIKSSKEYAQNCIALSGIVDLKHKFLDKEQEKEQNICDSASDGANAYIAGKCVNGKMILGSEYHQAVMYFHINDEQFEKYFKK